MRSPGGGATRPCSASRGSGAGPPLRPRPAGEGGGVRGESARSAMTSLVFDPAPSQPTCLSKPHRATVSQLSSRPQATPRPRVSLTGTQPVTHARPRPAHHSRAAPPPVSLTGTQPVTHARPRPQPRPQSPSQGLSLSLRLGPAPPVSHAWPRPPRTVSPRISFRRGEALARTTRRPRRRRAGDVSDIRVTSPAGRGSGVSVRSPDAGSGPEPRSPPPRRLTDRGRGLERVWGARL